MTHITYKEIMKSVIKLSFIIPIYNVEKYLNECIESILPYIDEHCEVILVDDGSTDSSSQICDEYNEKSDRIVVVHKTNGGLASARNAGLEVCTGEYVAFVDSDDRLHSEGIVAALKWIDNGGADLCFMQAEKFYSNGTIENLGDCISESGIRGKSKEEILSYISSRPKFPGSSCTKIYRRSFLKDNDIHFPYENIQSEDLGFVRDCIIKAETYGALDVPYYEYRQQRQESITSTVSVRGINGVLRFVEETIELYSKDKKPNEPYGKYAMSFGTYEYLVLLVNYAKTKDIEPTLRERIKSDKWILNYASSRRSKILGFMVGCLGIDLGAKLLLCIYKAKSK